MGFGTEILFLLMLGLVFLGPKQMHTMLQRVARAKAEFDKASRGLKAQLASELENNGEDKSPHPEQVEN